MEEGNEKNAGTEQPKKYEFFSKIVKAGRRTYFFDVRATEGCDLYMTISESKRTIGLDGNPYYEKHKIFLYREDFEAFSKGLSTVIKYINSSGGKIHTLRKPISHKVPKGTPIQDIDDAKRPIEASPKLI